MLLAAVKRAPRKFCQPFSSCTMIGAVGDGDMPVSTALLPKAGCGLAQHNSRLLCCRCLRVGVQARAVLRGTAVPFPGVQPAAELPKCAFVAVATKRHSRAENLLRGGRRGSSRHTNKQAAATKTKKWAHGGSSLFAREAPASAELRPCFLLKCKAA